MMDSKVMSKQSLSQDQAADEKSSHSREMDASKCPGCLTTVLTQQAMQLEMQEGQPELCSEIKGSLD